VHLGEHEAAAFERPDMFRDVACDLGRRCRGQDPLRFAPPAPVAEPLTVEEVASQGGSSRMQSTWKRVRTSSSTAARNCTRSEIQMRPVGGPRCRRRSAYANAEMPVDMWRPRSIGTRSTGSRRRVRTTLAETPSFCTDPSTCSTPRTFIVGAYQRMFGTID
jgi:hypothetical protein